MRHYGPGGLEHGGGIGRFIGYVTQAAATRGARHLVTDTRGPRWSRLRSPMALVRAVAVMTADRTTAPDRIHHIHVAGRGSTLRKLVLCATARRLGCRHVLHLHDYDYATDYGARSARQQAAIRAMFAGADAVIVLGRRDRDLVTGVLRADPARVVILHNCVPDPGARVGFPLRVPQILFLGQLGPRKGVPELIQALASPCLGDLAWRAVLAGDGPVETCRRQVADLGLGERVSLPGWLDADATAALRHTSHVLVLPSHAEGLSMAVLEGLASTLAVVTTPVGAHPEVLTDEETGLFVPPGDAAALAAALARLVGTKQLREGIAERGRQLFVARYSIGAYMDALEGLYARLAPRVPGSAPRYGQPDRSRKGRTDMSQLDKISMALAPPPAAPAAGPNDDWLDAASVFRIVRRRIGLILLVAALVVGAAIVPIMNMQHSYLAQSRLLIQEPPTARLTQPVTGRDSELNLAVEVERLLSRDVAARIVDELQLAERPEFNAALRPPSLTDKIKQTIRGFLKPAAPPSDDPAEENVVLAYLSHLSIARVTGSPVISISFRSEDPGLAAQVPNALIRTYLTQRAELEAQQIASARIWLDKRIHEQQQHLAGADSAAKTFRETSILSSVGALDIAKSVSALSQRRTDLQTRREDAAVGLSDVPGGPDGVTELDATGNPDQQQLFTDRLRLESELAHLRKTFGGNHPQVIAAQKELADTESLIRADALRQKHEQDNRLAALDREGAAISRRLAAAADTLTSLRSAEADLAALERAAKSEQVTLDGLEEQRRALVAAADVPVAGVEVLLPATVPTSPIGRGRSFQLALAIVAACALGFAAALLREMLDRTVRSADHVRQIPGAVPGGLVPHIFGWKGKRFAAAYGHGASAVHADAVREMIFALEQSRGGALPRSLLVTSARAGEGKTMLAAAVAVELSRSGHRVLLIDGALRTGTLHQLFGARAEPGLGEYLDGKAPLTDLEQVDVMPGISLLARGAAGSRWHLDRTRLRTLIESANRNGQVVVIDSGPALASAFTCVLASVVDRQLMVVRWASTSRGALASAIQRLQVGKADVIHVAINDVDLRRHALYGFSDAGDVARTLKQFQRATA